MVIQAASTGRMSAIAPLYFVPAASPAAAPASTNPPSFARSLARSDRTSVSVTKKVIGTSVRMKCDSRTCSGITAIRPAARSAYRVPHRSPAK